MLAAYVFGVRVPVRLSDVQLVAAVCVHFTPLVDELPCLGGLEVSLLGMPDHLDAAAVVPPGVDLMALPAMDVLLPWILRKIIGPMFVYPSRSDHPDHGQQRPGAPRDGDDQSPRPRRLQHAQAAKERPPGWYCPGSKLIGFGGERYQVRLYTREQRKVMLKSKSRDEPTWDELHYFLANPESTLHCILLTMNMRELGRCEIPMRLLCDPSREGKTANHRLPHRGPNAVPRARARTPGPAQARHRRGHREAEQGVRPRDENHREKLARLRLEQLANEASEPRPNTPTVAIDLEYVPIGAGQVPPDSLAGITSVASPGAKTVSGEEEEEEEEEEDAGNREGRVGILRVTVNRAVNVRKADNTKQPQPVCVAQISGQKFVTAAPVDKTNKPLWDETFLFFNVSDRDAVSLTLCDGGERGEFLGECKVDMRKITTGHAAVGHVPPGGGQEQRADLRAVQVLLPGVIDRRRVAFWS